MRGFKATNMLQLYIYDTASYIWFHLEWWSSSFRLHQIFPILIVQIHFFPNSTGTWPQLQKVGESLKVKIKVKASFVYVLQGKATLDLLRKN